MEGSRSGPSPPVRDLDGVHRIFDSGVGGHVEEKDLGRPHPKAGGGSGSPPPPILGGIVPVAAFRQHGVDLTASSLDRGDKVSDEGPIPWIQEGREVRVGLKATGREGGSSR